MLSVKLKTKLIKSNFHCLIKVANVCKTQVKPSLKAKYCLRVSWRQNAQKST